MIHQFGFWFALLIAFFIGLTSAYVLYATSKIPFIKQHNKLKLPSSYFKGFNFLLNEQSDEAVMALQQALKETADNVEIQLSLGNLFRRKGDIQRAIQIHQKLLEKEGLDEYSYALAMLELGQDFNTSGLYDRAESIFLEVINGQHLRERAARYLLGIYEQEKEWRSAIKVLTSHFPNDDTFFVQLSHYYCELADIAIGQGKYTQAEDLLKKAGVYKPANVRSDIQQGRILAAKGEHEKAIDCWQSVIEKNRSYLHEVLFLIIHSYQALDQEKALRDYLYLLVENYRSNRALILLARILYDKEGYEQASNLLRHAIVHSPSMESIRCLVEMKIDEIHKKGEPRVDLSAEEIVSFSQLLDRVKSRQNEYQCRSCGFNTESFYWQCSRCRQWSSVYAITRIE